MTTREAVAFGPRLIGSPCGTLRAAVLVKPTRAIEQARPRPGEPGAIYTRALEAHRVLVDTLAYFGVETVVFEPHAEDPYEAAVVDAAIVFEDGALMARPSAMSRRAEADRLEAEFARIDVPLAGHIAAPGLFDGGDVLLVGETAYVGKTARGNDLGRDGLRAVARAHGYRTVDVSVDASVPSLRAVASVVAKDTVVLAADRVDASAFAGLKRIELERGEELAAGVCVLGERHVIADTRYRTSLRRLRKAGVTVEAIDLYDFAKVGLTPSVLVLSLKRD